MGFFRAVANQGIFISNSLGRCGCSARRRVRRVPGLRQLATEQLELRQLMAVLDDSYGISSNGVLSIGAPGVLANDTDVALLDYFDETSVSGARVSWEADGSFTYDPT